METPLLYFSFAGLFVGLVVGLTGVGGGSIMTPILSLVFNVPTQIAVGTDLAFAGVTKSVGTLVHGLRSSVRWQAVKFLLLGSIPAALLSLYALHAFGNEHAALNLFIKRSIGVTVLLTVFALLFRKRLLVWLALNPRFILPQAKRGAVLVIGGAIIGGLVTVSSIGAGAIGATFLLFVNPEWDSAEVAGTDIAYAVPLTLVAGAGHAALGSVNWVLLAGLLIGSVPGIAVGSYFAKALPDGWVRGVLIAVLTYTGLRMVL